MKVTCVNKEDAKRVEADLRYLYFHDYDEPFIKWTRKGNTFEIQNEMDDITGKPGYVRQYLSKNKTRTFS